MKDSDIIKALECCKVRNCRNCSLLYSKDSLHCIKTLTSHSYDLINRQQAEIKKLKKDLKACTVEVQRSHEIDRNKGIIEFAERLKSIMHEYCNDITEDDIDNLVKEMTESITKIEHNSLCETETYKGGE